MKSKTQTILKVMNVLAWISFIALMVKAGALLFGYILTINNPDAAKHFYDGMNLYSLRQFDFVHYTIVVLMLALMEATKAYVAFLIIKVLTKIKMTNPFTIEVSKKLELISYFILLIWVMAVLHNGHINTIINQVPSLKDNLISGESLLLAGVVFLFAQIFKKGVELQTENELTV